MNNGGRQKQTELISWKQKQTNAKTSPPQIWQQLNSQAQSQLRG